MYTPEDVLAAAHSLREMAGEIFNVAADNCVRSPSGFDRDLDRVLTDADFDGAQLLLKTAAELREVAFSLDRSAYVRK